jgi:hypothetical protein
LKNRLFLPRAGRRKLTTGSTIAPMLFLAACLAAGGIPLKARADFQDPSRIPAMETTRV